jgi:hypothetical protein
MASLLERYADRIVGVLSCYDRVVIHGTLPGLCYPDGMTSYLYAQRIRIFDYPRFAEPFRDAIRENAERIARENGIEIDFLRKPKRVRKEDRIQEILAKRGTHPGLVHIFSAMEPCSSYQPWHDKQTGRTFLKPDSGKCVHYYFYFIDPELGLCYLRVPTWCPFRLQFYFNGHNLLAATLDRRGIAYKLVDNAFADISDFKAAQKLADDLDVKPLHKILDRYAALFCPAVTQLKTAYHWSLMQVEYATDIVFKRAEDLRDLYETLTRTAIHAVKADDVATFLGRKLHANYQGPLGGDFSTRIEGTRIRHHMGPASIKMYDKFGFILRIESTTNDVSFFKHHRTVVQKDGTKQFKLAPLRKTIYSLSPDLRELLAASNRRYLDFISEIDDPSAGIKALQKISAGIEENGRSYRGFNLFSGVDQTLFEIIARGEFNIAGLRNADLRRLLPEKSTSQISHCLKRFRTHGLLKRVGSTYKYYLTQFGRHVVLTALKLKELFLIPALTTPAPASASP